MRTPMQRLAERCILFIRDVFRQVTKCAATNFSDNITRKHTLRNQLGDHTLSQKILDDCKTQIHLRLYMFNARIISFIFIMRVYINLLDL